MRNLEFSSIWNDHIIGRKFGKRKRPFWGAPSRRFPFRVFSLSMALCTVLAMGTALADDRVRLKGFLIIDFEETIHHIDLNVENSQLHETIQIPRQRRFAGLGIPRWINGAEFRGKSFDVAFPNTCFLDELGNAGIAYLFLEKRGRPKGQRLMLKAKVLRNIFECLQAPENVDMKSVLDTDPFAGNHDTSQVGAMMLMLNQVLRAKSMFQEVVNGETNEEVLRRFFNIPEAYVWDRMMMENDSAMASEGQIDGMHREVFLRFREGGVPNLYTSQGPSLQ